MQAAAPRLHSPALAVALLGFALTAHLPAARVTLGNATGAAGGSVIVAVTLDPEGARVGGVQFDVEYDAARFEAVPLLGDAPRAAAKSVFVGAAGVNRQRFVVAGLNRNEIGGGAVLQLLVRIRPGAPAGAYPLFFHGLIATDPFGRPVTARATDGSVTVAGAPGSGPRLLAQGVLHAASLRDGAVSPGGIVTLFGSGIGPSQAQTPASPPAATELGGVSVRFDGLAAPLLYADPGQINAIVPFAIAGRTRVTLEVLHRAALVASLELENAPAVPAIFTQDGSGAGPGAILNQDGSLNAWSRPAAAGSIAVLFGTGFGETSPSLRDGEVVGGVLPALKLPVDVTVEGLPAEVLYAGPAPQLVAGVFQVNFRLPPGLKPGPAAVTVTAGGRSSPPGVTVSVQ